MRGSAKILLIVIGVVVLLGLFLVVVRVRDRGVGNEQPPGTGQIPPGDAITPPTSLPSGITDHTLSFGGRSRRYLLYVPSVLAGSSKSAPLILALHGGFGNAKSMRDDTTARQFEPIAERDGILIVYPEAVSDTKGLGLRLSKQRNAVAGHWNDGRGLDYESQRTNVDDVGFLQAVVDDIASQVSVDRSRVFITGMSNGGLMTQRVACEAPNFVAAAAPVAAALPKALENTCANASPLPMVFFNGTKDERMVWNATSVTVPAGTYPRLTIPDTLALFSKKNGCANSSETALPDSAPRDGTRVYQVTYQNCTAPLTQYRIDGGGHAWPGGDGEGNISQDINTGEEVWKFFESIVQ